jgi:hypothetical protein
LRVKMSNVYVFETKENSVDVVLQHPRKIHDELVDIVKLLINDVPIHIEDSTDFLKCTYFPNKTYVNSSLIENFNGATYTHTMTVNNLKNSQINLLKENLKKYTIEAKEHKNNNPNLFLDDEYPE